MASLSDLLTRLTPYKRRVRPAALTSFPAFMDGELLRIDQTTTSLVETLKAAVAAIREPVQGEQGPRGEKGDKGDPGSKGDPGQKGDPGDKGDPGTPGRAGTDGAAGRDGEDGAPGAASTVPGPQGPPGPKGDPGDGGAGTLIPLVNGASPPVLIHTANGRLIFDKVTP